MKIEVDARGLACPQPVIKTKKELDSIKQGSIVTLVDNEIARENILKLANSMNLKSNDYENNGVFYIEITKNEETNLRKNIENNDCNINIENKVILISSEFMGRGPEELGKILIKGFIYTLTELKPYPKSILFINSGVKLTTDNIETVENLKILESEGVEILSCGTCLDYLNVKDKLQVGKVSNMYDIVEKLKEASNSITI